MAWSGVSAGTAAMRSGTRLQVSFSVKGMGAQGGNEIDLPIFWKTNQSQSWLCLLEKTICLLQIPLTTNHYQI